MAIKKSQTTSKSPAKTATASAKKKITDTAKKAKKPESKKPIKALKAPVTKLSKPKTASKPAGAKSGPAIKKPLKAVASKKPAKTSVAIKKGKKAQPKGPLKTISPVKAATPEKKPLKKSTAKIVPSKAKVTQGKAIKPSASKKPSARTVSKVAAKKKEGKTAIKTKAPSKTVNAAIKKRKITAKPVKTAAPKVTQEKTIKPSASKKPSAPKPSKVAAGKTAIKTKAPSKTAITGIKKKSAISSTVPEIKETKMNEAALKPGGKTDAPLSTSIKTIMKKVTTPLITPGPPTSSIEKASALHTATAGTETKPKKVAKLKVFLPQEELPLEEAQRAQPPQLPQEYGENELLLMEVDPLIVFVSWEIRPDDISSETGRLALRVYDVTGIDFDGANAVRFFDIPLRKRADSKFFDIKMQGKDIIMQIGLLHPDGTFKTIKQSNRVSMPELQTFDEFGLTGPFSGPETLIGY